MKKLSFLFVCLLFSVTVSWAQWSSIRGEGPLVKKELDLETIEGVGLGISATVYLMQDEDQKVVIEAQQNIIDNLKYKVKDGVWSVEHDKNVRSHDDITIWVTLETVKELAIGGSGKIIGKDEFKMRDLEMSIGGSGHIELAGTAEEVEINIAGSGEVEAEDLKADRCEVSIAGSGDATIEVNGPLNVSIAGSGDVRYKGDAEVSSSIAGSGKVRRMN